MIACMMRSIEAASRFGVTEAYAVPMPVEKQGGQALHFSVVDRNSPAQVRKTRGVREFTWKRSLKVARWMNADVGGRISFLV